MFLHHGRGLEWMTSALLLVFAITLALPGDTLAENPGFAGFVSAGLNEAALALPLSWIALLRMAGLGDQRRVAALAAAADDWRGAGRGHLRLSHDDLRAGLVSRPASRPRHRCGHLCRGLPLRSSRGLQDRSRCWTF